MGLYFNGKFCLYIRSKKSDVGEIISCPGRERKRMGFSTITWEFFVILFSTRESIQLSRMPIGPNGNLFKIPY